jgi:hypothetical protein
MRLNKSAFQYFSSRWIGLVAAVSFPCVILFAPGLWSQFHNETLNLGYGAIAEAQTIAAKIDNHFDAIESLLDAVSAAASTNPNDIDRNDALLRRAMSEAPRFIANIIVFSLDGTNIGNAVGHHASAGDRDYFQRAKAGAPLVIGDPIRSRSNIGWVIPAARPIRNSAGEIQAVLVVATYLDSVQQMIGIDESPMGQFISVVNDRGIGIASNSTVVKNSFTQVGAAARPIRSKQGSELVTTNDNVTYIIGYTTTRRGPWLVTVGLPLGSGSARVANGV